MSPPTAGSARLLARKQGLARMSAVTYVIGVASVLGAVAIAVSLPVSTVGDAKRVDTVMRATSTDTIAR
jgi:hypothetical protein